MAPATPSNDKNNKKAVIKTDHTNNDGKLWKAKFFTHILKRIRIKFI